MRVPIIFCCFYTLIFAVISLSGGIYHAEGFWARWFVGVGLLVMGILGMIYSFKIFWKSNKGAK